MLKHKLNSIIFQKIFLKIHSTILYFLGYGLGGNSHNNGEFQLIRKFLQKNASPIIFDVGANVGEYSKYILKINNNCNIFCFEPHPNNFLKLMENLGNSKISLNNFGFGNKVEKKTLYGENTLASVYKRNIIHNPSLCFDKIVEVNMDTIDNFCLKNKIEKIDYLKLDIEGFEYFALLGALKMINLDKINLIQFEFGGCNIDSKTFFKDFWILLSEKYKIYRIINDGLYELTHYKESLEIFLTCNFLAINKNKISLI